MTMTAPIVLHVGRPQIWRAVSLPARRHSRRSSRQCRRVSGAPHDTQRVCRSLRLADVGSPCGQACPAVRHGACGMGRLSNLFQAQHGSHSVRARHRAHQPTEGHAGPTAHHVRRMGPYKSAPGRLLALRDPGAAVCVLVCAFARRLLLRPRPPAPERPRASNRSVATDAGPDAPPARSARVYPCAPPHRRGRLRRGGRPSLRNAFVPLADRRVVVGPQVAAEGPFADANFSDELLTRVLSALSYLPHMDVVRAVSRV